MRYLLFTLQILVTINSINAQNSLIEELRNKYISFEYQDVIQIADSLLKSNDLTDAGKTQVYMMKGISHYSLGQEELAAEAFRMLLIIDPSFSMDPREISPKIITFFNEIKVTYQTELEEDKPILDSLNVIKRDFASMHGDFKNAMIKNIFLPGWGQFQMGENTKGFVFTALTVASAGGMIYYIADTNEKEKAYLNETNRSLIDTKYDEFNSSFKTRNLLIGTTIVIWLVSQIDLIFFTEVNENSIILPMVGAGETTSVPSSINLNWSIPLN